MEMEVSIATIDVLDAEDIMRKVDLPTMHHSPLYRLMFPPWAEMTEAQQNEIVQWYSEGLRDALRRTTVNFIQIRTTNGTPLGFCGWAMEHGRHAGTKRSPVQPGQGQPLPPETLDLDAWLSISKKLRKERKRVLEGLNEVCRESHL